MDNQPDYTLYLEHDLDITSRTIFLSDNTEPCSDDAGDIEIDAVVAKKLIKNLFILNSINHEPISIQLNSEGGRVADGFAIYNAIKLSKSPVSITVFGAASSMASIILQAGAHRFMTQDSEMLIHYGSIKIDASVRDMLNHANRERYLMKRVEQIYMEKIKQKNPEFDIKILRGKLKEDTILTARECVELGLADKVI